MQQKRRTHLCKDASNLLSSSSRYMILIPLKSEYEMLAIMLYLHTSFYFFRKQHGSPINRHAMLFLLSCTVPAPPKNAPVKYIRQKQRHSCISLLVDLIIVPGDATKSSVIDHGVSDIHHAFVVVQQRGPLVVEQDASAAIVITLDYCFVEVPTMIFLYAPLFQLKRVCPFIQPNGNNGAILLCRALHTPPKLRFNSR